MSERDIDFPEKDRGLRDDVRLLGALVGEVIREQGGDALFERVEAVRRAAIRHRGGEPGSEKELRALLDALDPAAARELVRAFSTYFQMVNLAERVHRIRRPRAYEIDGRTQPEGLADSAATLRAAGIGERLLRESVARLMIEPVFTAHPTEAVRRTLLEKQQRVAEIMIRRFIEDMTPREADVAHAQLREEITTAWQTEEHSAQRMTVANERDNLLFFLGSVVYRVLPVFIERLEAQFGELPPQTLPVRFGSWVGGDMDGNPNVNAQTIIDTLIAHRALIVRRYRDELKDLYRLLSQSRSRVGADASVDARIRAYAAEHGREYESISHRHRNMPYRVLLRLMDARLKATLIERSGAYRDAHEFIADLEAIRQSLRNHHGDHAGVFQVGRLIRRAQVFGFHLAALDVRQHSAVFRGSVSALLNDADWLALEPAVRAQRLRAAWNGLPEIADDARDVLQVFHAIGEARRRFGERAVGDLIISMAQGADDLLGVLMLANRAGLRDEQGRILLDVVPLFETVDDLARAPAVMRELFADEIYRAHLAARGNRQRVMLGYSDSAKDGGVAASRWGLQRAQSELAEIAKAADVTLTFFHGRGGTVSRGGGKVHRAVLASPPGTVNGTLRVTEQGEIINARYGLRGIALRTLEQMAGAVLIADLAPPASHERAPQWADAMELVARESRRVYRALVYERAGFEDFFRRVTPIDVIERMKIGSRPSRRGGGGIENLRAIPWVFAWTQNRSILPAWYGIGRGLEALIARDGLDEVQRMAREWPFFSNLLDDAAMVLAKTDIVIAQRYFALAEEHADLVADIVAEHARTRDALLRVKGYDDLLDDDPALQRSIRLRNPYVDPMSLMQVELLRQWRAAGSEEGECLDALIATVNGIAQGLQNTG